VAALSYDASLGALAHVQSVPTLPEGFAGESTCADIHISALGGFAYASNRGHESIVIYRIDPGSGTLSYVAHESTRGRTPRSFDIDPSGRFLLAANQDSDSVASFRIDPRSGVLQASADATAVPTPVCVRFFPER
jgi:6-phosphogluconolactonase